MRKGKRKKLLSFALALSMVVTGTNVPMKQASAEEMQDGTVAEEGYTTPAPDEWYRTPAPYDEYATSVPDEWWNTTSAPDKGYATPAPDEWWNTTSAPDKNDQLVDEEDGYTAYLMFTDDDYKWENWNTQAEGGVGKDAVITGDGTYTVSINKEDFTNGEADKPANGVNVLTIELMGMTEAQNLDVSHMQIKDVTVLCDGQVFPTDNSKMYFGDMENKGNLRLEICNTFGWDGAFKTKDVFDPDGNFGFSEKLSVTFTLEGIQTGKTSYSTFHGYDSEEGVNKPLVWTLDQWNKEAGPVEEPVYTASPARTVSPDAKDLPLDWEDGYQAYVECGYNNRNEGKSITYSGENLDVLKNPHITGDGTYEVCLYRSLFDQEEEKPYVESTEKPVTPVPDAGSESGFNSLRVTFAGMAEAQNFDISNMAIKDVSVVCDGKDLIDDDSQLVLWNTGGNLCLGVNFAFDKENFHSFLDYIHITFTLKGIKRGTTPADLFYWQTVETWNAGVGDPDEDYPQQTWCPSYPTTGSEIYPSWGPSYPATGSEIWPSYPATGSEIYPTWGPSHPATGSEIYPTWEPSHPATTPSVITTPSFGPVPPEPTAQTSATPCPTESPEPSAIPTEKPTPVYPTVEPTKDPHAVATDRPVRTPGTTGNDIWATAVPTKVPVPTVTPSEEPTGLPEVTQDPSVQPGDEPVVTPGDQTSSDQQPNGQPDTALPDNPAGPNRDALLAVNDPTEVTIAPIPAATILPGEEYDVDDEDEEDDVEKGSEIEDKSGSTYTVTQTGKKAEVEYSAPKENAKGTVKIPDKVTINGVSYKVTSVAANAFKNNDKVKKVVLNNNITSIGKNAFSGCKNLKTITITSTKLTSKSISKNAFKGISGKVVIKVPKGMKKKYKKLFRAKGLSKKVRIV